MFGERRKMRRAHFKIGGLLTCFLLVTLSQLQPAAARTSRVVTAAQANGVYRFYYNEFRILALGHGKLKVQFDGIYHTLAKSVNLGSASGEATIECNVATFVPADTTGCKI